MAVTASPSPKADRAAPAAPPTFKARVLGFLIASFIRLYSRTLRIRFIDQAGIKNKHGVIWAFWHNRVMTVPLVYLRYLRKDRQGCVLTSPSRDGAVLASVMKQFGLDSVRGSSNKRAAQSLVECRRRLLSGWDLAITPDGPRGPVYVAAPGVLQLARLTQCPVMPILVDYSRKWELKSWDRFQIPKPFSRVTITLTPLITFGAGTLEEECILLQQKLSASTHPTSESGVCCSPEHEG
ncbi:MAG TPA: lysophospholipid acyltransferase family protein [Verrucomicrobiales bacterium]|nr:lysophospholipid acyltransferase family protein [Verrucomicrobiales bacterium]